MPDTTCDALFAELEENPGDRLTLLALADWLEEHDDLQGAEAIRWIASEGKSPFRYEGQTTLRYQYEKWHMGWYWWTTDEQDSPWGYPPACILPNRLWNQMEHTFPYDPGTFKEYPTVRVALERVMEVWRKGARP